MEDQPLIARAPRDGATASRPLVERFRSWLRERRLPVTSQRMAIADILLTTDRHLAAEDVVQELERRGAKVGTATVYRTLDALVASGLVVERDFSEGFRRFEPVCATPQEAQLRCTTCGRTEEFREDALEGLTRQAAELRGFERERIRLVVYGTCRACLARRDEALA